MTRVPASMCGGQMSRQVGPKRLIWREDIAVPRPGPGEVLVRVLAAGVHMSDANTRRGWPRGEGRAVGWAGEMALPRLQRSDLCARVVALGAGVEGIALGARVLCPTHPPELTTGNPITFVSIGPDVGGGFAQYCVVKAGHLQDVSASALTDIAFEAMPCVYGTAHNLLTRAEVAVGERVLVTGASGGAGLAAVHLALLAGAEVTGQCSLSKSTPLRGFGAQVLPVDAVPPLQSFDVVIDAVGGEGWPEQLDCLRPGGRYATSGAVAGPMVKGDQRRVYLNDLTIYGATHQPREVFAGLVTVITTGRIRPVVSNIPPLQGGARMQDNLVAGRALGNLVLISPETSL